MIIYNLDRILELSKPAYLILISNMFSLLCPSDSFSGTTMYLGENSEEQISRDSTVCGLGLSIVSVLYGRGRVVAEGAKDEGTIQVKLQTKDRRAQPVILDIRPIDTMETVMEKFSTQTGLDRKKLKFFFDGEQLEGETTAEDLELEGGECFDVHVAE